MALYSTQDSEAEDGWLADINTTLLVDVMLVLLIIFLITIPVPLHSVNLDMPSRRATTAVPEVVVLQIDAQSFVLWGSDKLSSLFDVNTRIAAAAAQPAQPEIHVQPSSDAPYAFVAGVLGMAKKAGLQGVGVVN